jgi:integrase
VSTKSRRRRSPGEGGAYSYRTRDGVRWYWKAVIKRAAAEDGKPTVRRGYLTKADALDAMAEARRESKRGGFVDPSRQQLGAYLDEWLAGLRLEPSTVASYRISARCHLTPYLGTVPLASLTTARIDSLYRQLEREGRRDTKGELAGEGLSASTVRYVHTILSAALSAAVDAGQLRTNPAQRAHPPTGKQVMAQREEMHPWTAGQLATFLDWAREHSSYHVLWHVLAFTGMRRGEALGLRWRDIDLDAGTVAVRRGARMLRWKGESAEVHEGPTKGHKARVVDIDPSTVALLRAWRRERGGMALQLARDDALVFGSEEGALRNPEYVSQTFKDAVARCRRAAGEDAVPAIRLHDLRHTHATILLSKGVPVKVVSERLGHANVTTTLQVYGHVMPGDQRRAAEQFAGLVGEGPQ